eukprot:1678034-Amphidinium_carterae.2
MPQTWPSLSAKTRWTPLSAKSKGQARATNSSVPDLKGSDFQPFQNGKERSCSNPADERFGFRPAQQAKGILQGCS